MSSAISKNTKTRVIKMLNKTQLGKKIVEIVTNTKEGGYLDKENREWVLSVLKEIPRFSKLAQKEKIQIQVKTHQICNRKIKALTLRVGNKVIPVTKKSIVDGVYPPKENPVKDVREGFRNTIQEQIRGYRRKLKFPYECPMTGKIFNNQKEVEIDHEPPLAQLVEEWLEIHDLYYDEIKLGGPKNRKIIADRELRKDWERYHRANAGLTAICPLANSSKNCGDFKGTNRASRRSIE